MFISSGNRAYAKEIKPNRRDFAVLSIAQAAH